MSIKKWVAKKWESRDPISLRFSVFLLIASVPICFFFMAISTSGFINYLAAFATAFLLCLILIGAVMFLGWLYEKLMSDKNSNL